MSATSGGRPAAPAPSGAWRRTHTCGELRQAQIGQRVVLNGWVHSRRNLGGIYFVDLRDRYGLTQIKIPTELGEKVAFSAEWVLSVRGEVVQREAPNRDMPTGEVELRAEAIEVLSDATVPPFEIRDELGTAVETRLQYRYIDLRRRPLQQALIHRSRFINAMRRAFEKQGFIEVETPILTKATPEGARDYLVPSRVHPGHFYALPQSPQIFKQILQVAGFDRYFQVARCFRDEDLRADRQPEFTQLDMEMSFVVEEDIFRAWEQVLVETFQEAMGLRLSVPFPRLSWRQAMERYGVDKPDTRFGMQLVDVAAWVPKSGFGVFQAALARGERVLCLPVSGGGEAISRGQMKSLEDLGKTYGAGGIAWWKPGEEGGGAGPIAKFMEGASGAALLELTGAKSGDLLLFCAAKERVAWAALGALRNHLGKRLGLIPAGQWNFLWVTEFPMFELDEESGRWTSAHHPFTAPVDTTLGGENPDRAGLASRAYDLVLNGWELGSGSIRIHQRELQARVFRMLGISEDEARRKFGFLLEALASGAPPHGGFAMGLDRVVALSLGQEQIRDVIAFPKTTSATDLMCGAPSTVSPEQLAEVHVGLAGKAKEAGPGSRSPEAKS
jgi:aspartyl-tRNA synthetase